MTPLVEGKNTSPKYRAALLAHATGAGLAGAGLGAVFGLLGRGVLGGRMAAEGVAPIAVLGMSLGLLEVGLLRLPVPQVPRQTSKQWREWLGPVAAPLAWGLDLGSGVTTYVPFAAYWILPIAAFARGEPSYGALILGLFGVARAVTVVVASLNAREAAALPGIGEGTPFHAVLSRLRGHSDISRRQHGWGIVGVCAAVLLQVII